MRPIPPKLRARIAADPFMAFCVYGLIGRSYECRDRFGFSAAPSWEHAFVYAGRQINEAWAIVPVCWFHHQGPGLDKRFNEYVALLRASPADLARYPRVDWAQKKSSLSVLFGRLLPSLE